MRVLAKKGRSSAWSSITVLPVVATRQVTSNQRALQHYLLDSSCRAISTTTLHHPYLYVSALRHHHHQQHHHQHQLYQQQQQQCNISTKTKVLLDNKGKNDNDDEGGLLGSASEYFGSLRWQAANALTSSLSKEERDKLLETMEPKLAAAIEDGTDDDDDENNKPAPPPISIAEAVAAARAKEAQFQQAQWEQQKEELYKEAEEAARQRVESDLAIQKRRLAFEAWQQSLEKEKAAEAAAEQTSEPESVSSNPEPSMQAVKEEDYHPVLGPLVVDLGVKRIYTVSAKVLSAIPVWEKQRTYRHSRAKSMAADKQKSLHLGFPGIIGLYEKADGSLYILDGQHRVGMLKVLQDRKSNSNLGDLDHILVEVYPEPEIAAKLAELGEDENKLQGVEAELFTEVNKAEPVKLIDMPGVAKASVRRIIDEAATNLHQAHPKMFSESSRCRQPHVNIDNLRDALFASKVIDRRDLKSGKALETWILEQNDAVAKLLTGGEVPDATKPPNGIKERPWKKAVEHHFFLGLDSNWYRN